MFFRQLYDDGLAQASYIIGCDRTGEAVVVDPRRDIDVYEKVATAHSLRIAAVAETHIHADYLSGGRELAAAASAPLFVSGHGDAEFGYLPVQEGVDVKLVRDGDRIHIGDVSARVRHTPGHTPEHICFEIFDGARATEPMLLLSGDFFFVGDLGRPDLLEEALGVSGAARSSAHVMYASLTRALAELPDYVQLWPAHGAGSACGKALGAVPSTTLGYERRFSWWSGFARRSDEAGFVEALLDGQPDVPSYFARMKHLNRGLTPILGRLPKPARLDVEQFSDAMRSGALLIDTRPRTAFCVAHAAGAVNVYDKPSFSLRSAWFASPDRQIVLLAPAGRVNALVRSLVRVGLDRIAGYVESTEGLGQKTASLPSVTLDEVARLRNSGEAVIVDVRQNSEYAHAHIPGSTHVSAGRLLAKLDDIPKDRPLVVVCAGGDRSVAVASMLSALGFAPVANVPDGFDGWQARGLPVESGLVRS